MCGVLGLVSDRGAGPADREVAERMVDQVAHRGPDGRGLRTFGAVEGRWREVVDAWSVALGHRRLSILDLSQAGAQPMRRNDLWLSYNGEIYNFVELRAELQREGHQFVTHTDSEVVLAAFEQWGVRAFARFRGMWAILILDLRRGELVFSRDRLGIKPLYVARAGDWTAFVSEPKQLTPAPWWCSRANDAAVLDYLATGWESTDRSFFEGLTPVEAGTFTTLTLATGETSCPESFWFPERVTARIKDPREAAGRIEDALTESVRIHLRSDVPVGCALSGGLDSSSVAALAADDLRKTGARLEAFSITFPGFEKDERCFVDDVLRRTNAAPHFCTPTPDELLQDFDAFVRFHDEPVGSLSQYGAFRVARMARESGVPVSLNGQGGDEVLGGYWQIYLAHLASMKGARRRFAALLDVVGTLGPKGNPELLREMPRMAARALTRVRPSATLQLRRAPSQAQRLVGNVLAMTPEQQRVFEIRGLTLPRLLKWDDRNFMSHGIEGRYPFLDHVLIERALEIDRSTCMRHGWTKAPLRDAMASRLPPSITHRRDKVGFETPQDAWLRGPLADTVQRAFRGESPLWSYVSPASVADLRRRRPTRETHQTMYRLLHVDRWHRVLGVEVPS